MVIVDGLAVFFEIQGQQLSTQRLAAQGVLTRLGIVDQIVSATDIEGHAQGGIGGHDGDYGKDHQHRDKRDALLMRGPAVGPHE